MQNFNGDDSPFSETKGSSTILNCLFVYIDCVQDLGGVTVAG